MCGSSMGDTSNLKAVTITQGNQLYLANRYRTMDLDEFPIGFIMVAAFGDNGEYRYDGVLTEAKFNEKFTKGRALENGFYSITRK